MNKVHCRDCFHAIVSHDTVCYCNLGRWYNRLYKHIYRLVRYCTEYERSYDVRTMADCLSTAERKDLAM